MRANSDRSGRGYFAGIWLEYDRGRPPISGDVVSRIIQAASVKSGDVVVEAGCGSGQLTGALLAAGLKVVGVELGEQFCCLCEERYPDREQLRVLRGEFEVVPADIGASAVISSNAFHWFDPLRSYKKAREWLLPGGTLVLTWSCPVLHPELQGELNGLLRDRYIPAEWDVNRLFGTLHESQQGGIVEIAREGFFEVPESWSTFTPVRQDALSFALHVLSYHCVGGYLAPAKVEQFVGDVVDLVERTSATGVDYCMYTYIWKCSVKP